MLHPAEASGYPPLGPTEYTMDDCGMVPSCISARVILLFNVPPEQAEKRVTSKTHYPMRRVGNAQERHLESVAAASDVFSPALWPATPSIASVTRQLDTRSRLLGCGSWPALKMSKGLSLCDSD